MIKQDRGTPFNVVASGTSVVSATVSGASTQTVYVTDFSVSSDIAFGTMTIMSSGTIIFIARITNNQPFDSDFVQPLRGTQGTSVIIATTGTSLCYVNMSGFIINNV